MNLQERLKWEKKPLEYYKAKEKSRTNMGRSIGKLACWRAQIPYMEVIEPSWRRYLSQSAPLIVQARIWWSIAVVSALESVPCEWGGLLSLIQNGESHTTTRSTGLLPLWGRALQVSKKTKEHISLTKSSCKEVETGVKTCLWSASNFFLKTHHLYIK